MRLPVLLRLDLLLVSTLILALLAQVGNLDADDEAPKDAPEEVRPERVDALQQEDGRKDLVPALLRSGKEKAGECRDALHPGGHPTAVDGGEDPPPVGRAGSLGPGAVEGRDEVELVPDGPQDHTVEVAAFARLVSAQFGVNEDWEAHCRM